MAWFVVLSVSTTAGTGDVTASVVQAADSQALKAKYGVTGSSAGVPGETDAGYPTQAAAQHAADAYNSSGAGKGATGAPAPPGSGLPKLPGIPSPFGDVASALSAFYDKVTDGKMWRSLGWLLLGIALMLLGVAAWIGPSAARQSPLTMAARALG